MKRSTVITIVVVIAALIVIYGIQQVSKSRRQATPAGDFVKILPKDMRAADIHRIEIYPAGGRDAKKDAIVLARTRDGWGVPSRFNSKGNEENIKDLLDDIKKLEGEVRTKKKSLHEDFDITDKKAVHLALYKQNGKLYRDLLLGKKGERWGEGFVRLADSNEVYLADKNLLGTLGIYSEDSKLDAKKWLDLKIVDEESEKIVTVALDMPGKKVVLEKREKVKKKEEEQPEEEKPPEPEKKKEEKKEYEWVLAKPEIEFKLKESTVKSLVKSVSEFKAEDVADPAKMDEYGFDSPTYSATLTLDDETTETILIGKKPEEDNKRYAKLKDGNTIYIVPQYTVTGVFKKMRELVDIKIWDLKKDDVASVDLHRPEYEILLERHPKESTEGKEPKDYEWVLAKPQTRFKLKDFRITSILSRVTKPSPQDLFITGALKDYGLDEPEFKATVKMKDDSTHVLNFGKQVEETTEDRYVQFEGKDHVYSFTKYNFQDLFPTLPKLLTIEIMKGLQKDEIVSLKYDTAEQEFLLRRKGDTDADKKKWSLKTDKEESDAKTAIVDEILDAITAIKPEDMAVALSPRDCGLDKPSDTLTISTKKTAAPYTLLFGKEVSEKTTPSAWYFKIKNEPEIFVLSEADFGEIFRKVKDLRVEKPSEPEEEKPPAAEKAGPSVEKPSTPPTKEKPAASEEKPAPPREKAGQVPEKEEGKPEATAPEKQPEVKKEKPESAAPEKEVTSPPQPEGEEEKEEKPPAQEMEKPAPKTPPEKPSLRKPKENFPLPPLPEPASPKEPIPLPATPEKE